MKRDNNKKIIVMLMMVMVVLSAVLVLLINKTVYFSPLGGNYSGGKYGEGVYAGPSLVILPSLSVSRPLNYSYVNSLVRIVLSSNANNCWYVLDGLRGDISCNEAISLDRLNAGEHNILIYANNSEGLISEGRKFNVSYNRRFLIRYFEFGGIGATTNLDSMSDIELENASLVLQIPGYGKIAFIDKINLTADADKINNVTDIDAIVNISYNRIEINSALAPSLNKRARLTLEDLSFSNPRIYKDGGLCGASECAKEDYSGEDLLFNVTGFSVYSAQEGPTNGDSTDTNTESNTGNVNVVTNSDPADSTEEVTQNNNNNEGNIERVSLGEEISLIDVSDGDKVALISSDGQEIVATIEIGQNGIILRVPSGEYAIDNGKIVSAMIANDLIYFGIRELGETTAKIAISSDKKAIEKELNLENNLLGVILWITIILLSIGIIVVVIILVYYLKGNKTDENNKIYPAYGKNGRTINFINSK